MTTRITMVPAHGRDYKNKKDVIIAFNADLDFEIADISSQWNGKPANRTSLKQAGIRTANIRYKRLTRVAVITV